MEYLVVIIFIVVIAALLGWVRSARQRSKVRKLIRKHLKTLLLKKVRGFRRDDYGNIVDSGWSKELAYFYDNVIPPSLHHTTDVAAVASLIDREIKRLPDSTVSQWTMADRHDISTGDDFERFVKGELEDRGWRVRHTGRSGDQGADLIAEKGPFSVAVQCKLYTKPVGNKAVQEALAAQRYYATHFAAVISNAKFTPSAARLAGSADALLLHTSEIDRLDRLAEAP